VYTEITFINARIYEQNVRIIQTNMNLKRKINVTVTNGEEKSISYLI